MRREGTGVTLLEWRPELGDAWGMVSRPAWGCVWRPLAGLPWLLRRACPGLGNLFPTDFGLPPSAVPASAVLFQSA